MMKNKGALFLLINTLLGLIILPFIASSQKPIQFQDLERWYMLADYRDSISKEIKRHGFPPFYRDSLESSTGLYTVWKSYNKDSTQMLRLRDKPNMLSYQTKGEGSIKEWPKLFSKDYKRVYKKKESSGYRNQKLKIDVSIILSFFNFQLHQYITLVDMDYFYRNPK